MILGPLRYGLWFRRMVLEAVSGVTLREMKLDKNCNFRAPSTASTLA